MAFDIAAVAVCRHTKNVQACPSQFAHFCFERLLQVVYFLSFNRNRNLNRKSNQMMTIRKEFAECQLDDCNKSG